MSRRNRKDIASQYGLGFDKSFSHFTWAGRDKKTSPGFTVGMARPAAMASMMRPAAPVVKHSMAGPLTALLPLWDLNACTIRVDAAAFSAAGINTPLQLAQAYGIPLQGPGGLNQAQVGTTMDPATYFHDGAVLRMPKAACDRAAAGSNTVITDQNDPIVRFKSRPTHIVNASPLTLYIATMQNGQKTAQLLMPNESMPNGAWYATQAQDGSWTATPSFDVFVATKMAKGYVPGGQVQTGGQPLRLHDTLRPAMGMGVPARLNDGPSLTINTNTTILGAVPFRPAHIVNRSGSTLRVFTTAPAGDMIAHTVAPLAAFPDGSWWETQNQDWTWTASPAADVNYVNVINGKVGVGALMFKGGVSKFPATWLLPANARGGDKTPTHLRTRAGSLADGTLGAPRPQRTYTVQHGDTFMGIARKTRTPVGQILAWNPTAPTMRWNGMTILDLHEGQVITVPLVVPPAGYGWNDATATFVPVGRVAGTEPSTLGAGFNDDCSDSSECDAGLFCAPGLGVCIGVPLSNLPPICVANWILDPTTGGCINPTANQPPPVAGIATSLMQQNCEGSGGQWDASRPSGAECLCPANMKQEPGGTCIAFVDPCPGGADDGRTCTLDNVTGICLGGNCVKGYCKDPMGNVGVEDGKGNCVAPTCGQGQGRGAETQVCMDCGINGFKQDGVHCNECPPGSTFNPSNSQYGGQSSCDCPAGKTWNADSTACKAPNAPPPPAPKPTCTAPQTYDPNSNTCISPKPPGPPPCSPSQTLDTHANACVPKQTPPQAAATPKSNTALIVGLALLGTAGAVGIGYALNKNAKKRKATR